MAAEPFPAAAGGPFRRRPFRRAATPYDRPSVAARPPGGWISRVVDPASRMIAAGASRFLAPLFRKRLTAPPVENPQAQGNEHIESAATNIECAKTDVQFKEPAPDIVPMNHICEAKNDAESSKVNSNSSPVFELEQLLKQKTFTRVEYDRLSDLLRSRTVDLSPEKETKRVEHVISGPILQLDRMQKGTPLLENGTGGQKLFQEISRPNADVNVPEEDIASPTELAKAYMGSRSSKLPTSISSLRYPAAPRDAPMVPTTRQLMPPPSADILSAPRSSARVSGLGGNAYRTPRSQGRSAISRMSQSPYFKPQQMVSAQGRELSGEAYAASSTSQLTPSSGSKQALKRRSPFLDNDPGSFGPIRRIRQKSNLGSHSKENSHTASGYPSFSTPTQRVFSSSGYNRDFPALEDAKNVENGNSYSEFSSSTPQSSVMARKILQHIDQMAPSPKEKRKDKMITRDEFPSELTVNMLNGQALKSVKEIDSSKLSDGKIHEKLGSDNDVVKRSKQASFPLMEESVENDKHSKSPSVSKTFSGIGGADGLDAPQVNNKGSAAAAGSASAGFSGTLHNKRPSFQMQAPEDSWEFDADMYGTGGSTLPIEKKENENSSLAKASDVTIKAVSNTKLFESSTEKNLNLNTVSGKGTLGGRQNGPAALGKDNGFKFAVSSFNTDSALPPTPSFSTITPPKEKIPVRFYPKDQSVAPVFDFGSKKTIPLAFTSATPNASGSAGMNLGEMSNSKVEIPGSITSTVTMSKTETPESDKGKEGEKVSGPLKPFENFGSPFATTGAASVSSVFGFSASSAPSNGTLTFTPSTTSVSASAALPASDTMATATVSTPNNQPIFDSTSKPVSPPVTSFESGFAPKPSSTDLVPATTSKFESKYSEPKASKGSDFGVTSFSAPVSSIFSSSTSGIFGFNVSAPSNASSASGQSSSTQPSPLSTGASIFCQSSSSELASSISSSAPALSSSSSFGLSSTVFGSSAAGSKPFSFGASSGSGLNSSTTSSASVAAPSFSTSSPFGSSMPSSGLFSTSQPAQTSMFGSGSSSLGFSFGQSPASSANAPTFGSASVPAFSFTSAASAAPAALVSPQQSGFGMSTPVTFGSSISGGDQMSVEDSMTDDTVHLSMPVVPAFGQATPSPTQPVAFSSLQPSGGVGFQFGGQTAPSFPQSQSPFQTSGSLDFQQGGSFSLGSGGGDKSNRRMVKVKRDKHRKK